PEANKNRLFFPRPELKAFTQFMFKRFRIFSALLAVTLLTSAHLQNVAGKASPTPAPSKPPSEASAGAKTSPAAPAPAKSGPAPAKGGRTVVDQTAQVLVFGWHRFVDKVRRPDTEITPAAFDKQMQELKDHGTTVINMQDFLAWKRGKKSIPPPCAVLTLDGGWKSQYEVAWPIL